MTSAKVTTDHKQIRKWVESRGGHPAAVKRTDHGNKLGVLRIDFPGFSGEDSLERVDWEPWFETFEQKGLAFLYQETTADGSESRFNKLVSRQEHNSGHGSHK